LFQTLPDITFAERDPAIIERDLIRGFEEAYQLQYGRERKLYPGDPVRLFLDSIAFTITHQRQLIDDAGKMNLLAYARGGYLEHIGAMLGVHRLPAKPSMTTLKFTLSAPQSGVTLVPAGTRATPGGGNIVFATSATAEIPEGAREVEVQAKCTINGAAGNNFVPGQIRPIVDPFPWQTTLENTTVSYGGVDIESDENLRERIQLAPERFSVAGPRGAYVYWARTASQLISDVGVRSPSPGVVHVYPLLVNGVLPTQEILDLVYKTISADDIRPTSEFVQVLSPEAVEYELDCTWYLERRNITQANAINQAVNSAVESWIDWQKTTLGRNINPSEFIRRIVTAGAKRVEVRSPNFQALEYNQVAVPYSVNVIYGGVEDG